MRLNCSMQKRLGMQCKCWIGNDDGNATVISYVEGGALVEVAFGFKWAFDYEDMNLVLAVHAEISYNVSV